jgi:hypothetical protein
MHHRPWFVPDLRGPAGRAPCPSIWRLFCLAGLLLLAHPAIATSQTPDDPAEPPLQQEVHGVVAEADGRPVLGALVALEDGAGQRLSSTLTDETGRFFSDFPLQSTDAWGARTAIVDRPFGEPPLWVRPPSGTALASGPSGPCAPVSRGTEPGNWGPEPETPSMIVPVEGRAARGPARFVLPGAPSGFAPPCCPLGHGAGEPEQGRRARSPCPTP